MALEEYSLNPEAPLHGFVRSALLSGIPYTFQRWTKIPITEADEIGICCIPLPKRRNFLHRSMLAQQLTSTRDVEDAENLRKEQIFPASSCTVDLLPIKYARFGLFISAVQQHTEVLMVAHQLCQTLLKDVPFNNMNNVVTAISAPSTQWVTDYQQYEFLGDSLLKYIVSCQLFMDNQNWHEGILSERRKQLVSNSRLARVALDRGLDAFVLTKSSVGRKWTHPLISNLMTQPKQKRNLSSKTLADVVEALIGAAFIDGDLSSARACLHAFLPEISNESPISESIVSLRYSRPAPSANIFIDAKVESLIGYSFDDKALLLEALTHPSCERDTVTESYQRLEYLGDAILDAIVVLAMFDQCSSRSHGEMTALKAALVNADLLAFLCMETFILEETSDIQEMPDGSFRRVQGEKRLELWKFMRHHSQEVVNSQHACLQRHEKLRQDVQLGLTSGKAYPWTSLVELCADKFFSDLIESVLGAIFLDSKGSLHQCQQFVERLGLLPYLRQIVKENIDVTHPKTALGLLTGSDVIEYIVNREGFGGTDFECLVKVQGSDVATVRGCLTKNEAMVKGAQAAVEQISRARVDNLCWSQTE